MEHGKYHQPFYTMLEAEALAEWKGHGQIRDIALKAARRAEIAFLIYRVDYHLNAFKKEGN